MQSIHSWGARVAALLLWGLAMPVFAAPAVAGASSGEAQVKAVVEQFRTAWNQHQIDSLTQLFTTDGSFKSPAGDGAQSRPAIRKLLAREHHDIFMQSTLVTTIENVTFPKTGTATVTGTFTLSDIPVVFGIEVSREGDFDFRLTQHNGRWLIKSARIGKE